MEGIGSETGDLEALDCRCCLVKYPFIDDESKV